MSEQHLPGGTLRITFGDEDEAVSPNNGPGDEAFRGQGPTGHITRVDHEGNATSSAGITRWNSGDETAARGPGIIASAQNSYGTPTGDLNRPGVSVAVEGTRVAVKTAVTMGLLISDGRGGYTEPQHPTPNPALAPQAQQPTQPAQQQPAQQQQQSDPHAFADEQQQWLHLVDSEIPSSVMAEALAQHMAGKPANIGALARTSGQSEARVTELVQLAHSAFGISMYQAAKAEGVSDVDQADFGHWLKTHPDGKRAVIELTHARSTGGIRELARLYQQTPPNLDSLRAAPGVKVFERNGVAYATLPDGTTASVAALAKLGKI